MRRLRIARGGARWLQVTTGELWLTRSGSLDDHWLLPGDALCLEHGADTVIEAAGDACFELLEPPQAQRPLPQSMRRIAAAFGRRSRAGRRPARGVAAGVC